MISSISCMGNPAVWWFGLVALLYVLLRAAWKKRAPEAYVIVLIGFASQFLPWVLVPRSTFIYHYFASVPFIILMVAMLPVAKFIVGTSLGNKAVIVTLVIAAAPYVARMVESSIKEVDKGVIEAAEAMGTPRFQIITKVLVPEAKPSLITGAVISMVTVLGYSAMAATIGGTGLGQIAIVYGHQRFNQDIIWFAALLCIIIVQVIQEVGMYIVRKTDKRTSA